MTVKLRGDGWTPRLHQLVARLDATLERRLRERSLDGDVEAHLAWADDGQAELKLTLALDGDVVLITHDRDDEAASALRMSYDALMRDVDEAFGGGTPEGARMARVDDDLRRRLAAEVMPAALRIAHHELAMRQLTQEIPPGWLDPHDLADEALVHVLGDARADRQSAGLVHAIEGRIRARMEEITQEIGTGDTERALSLDSDAEERDADGVSPLWDELRDFWVMDQALHLQDVLPDAAAKSPEDVVESKEVRHALVTALFDLPYDVRWVFGRVVSDGASPAEVASATGLDEGHVRMRVEQACDRLARKLFPGGDGDAATVRELYTTLGGKLRHLATGG